MPVIEPTKRKLMCCQECPFDGSFLVSPPGWLTAGEPEPDSPAYIRHDNIHFKYATPSAFLPSELDLRRLEVIEKYLWLAGRPMPARPLHAQLSMNRSIMLAEQLDMHLLWQDQRVFLKPLPRYLLRVSFWQDHLVCPSTCSCRGHDGAKGGSPCTTTRLRSIAFGFLLSWISLIQYESDLHIAQAAHVVPMDLSWPFWHSLVLQLIDFHDHPGLHHRWSYGELRMHRINLIYRLAPGGSLMRGYRSSFREYKAYVQYAFAYFVGIFGILSITLNAFQVGLSTDRFGSDISFQSISGGFAVFAIVGIIAAIVLLFVGLVANLYFNLHATLRFRAKRQNTLAAEML